LVPVHYDLPLSEVEGTAADLGRQSLGDQESL
jgi:hypothetical protein